MLSSRALGAIRYSLCGISIGTVCGRTCNQPLVTACQMPLLEYTAASKDHPLPRTVRKMRSLSLSLGVALPG